MRQGSHQKQLRKCRQHVPSAWSFSDGNSDEKERVSEKYLGGRLWTRGEGEVPTPAHSYLAAMQSVDYVT